MDRRGGPRDHGPSAGRTKERGGGGGRAGGRRGEGGLHRGATHLNARAAICRCCQSWTSRRRACRDAERRRLASNATRRNAPRTARAVACYRAVILGIFHFFFGASTRDEFIRRRGARGATRAWRSLERDFSDYLALCSVSLPAACPCFPGERVAGRGRESFQADSWFPGLRSRGRRCESADATSRIVGSCENKLRESRQR